MIASQLIVDECRAAMRRLPGRCVQTVVTSPPYWGLRDYGIAPTVWGDGWVGVLGLEPTPEQFIANLVEVFREVRRVLRDDGTLWLNLGDSYSTNGKLMNMPHRAAEALAAGGWYWRSTVIWAKRSPMPESLSGYRWRRHQLKIAPSTRHPGKCGTGKEGQPPQGAGLYRAARDGRIDAKAKCADCPGCAKCTPHGGYVLRRGKWRPTTAHEYVFLFSKSADYFCDGDAVQEVSIGQRNGTRGANGTPKGSGKRDPSYQHAIADATEQRNPRSVWLLSTEPYRKSHFATFSTRLVKKCVEASTSAHGCCPACEACYAPVIETERVPTRPAVNNKIWKAVQPGMGDNFNGTRRSTSPNLDPERHVAITRVTGYRPTCICQSSAVSGQLPDAGSGHSTLGPQPCMVFDPFAGSGTTLQTAKWLGRRWLGCEVSQAYAVLAEERIRTPPKWALKRGADARQREFTFASQQTTEGLRL